MPDRNRVIKSMENCLHEKECNDCSYEGCVHTHGSCIGDLMAHALELLKNETAAPTSPTYFRLMAIKDELETENKTLKEDVKELRRLTGSLTNLCENLLLKEQPEQKLFVDSNGKIIPLPIQKHGYWKTVQDYDDEHWKCSVCGCEWYLEAGTPEDNSMCYCPECGAKMDEGAKPDA